MNQKKIKYTARKSTAGVPRINPNVHLFRLRLINSNRDSDVQCDADLSLGEPRHYNLRSAESLLIRRPGQNASGPIGMRQKLATQNFPAQNALLPVVPGNNHPRPNQRPSVLDLFKLGYHWNPTPRITPVRVNPAQNEPGQIAQSHNDPVINVQYETEAIQNGRNGPIQAKAAYNDHALNAYLNLISNMSAELEPRNQTFVRNSGAKAIMQRLIGWNSVDTSKDTFSKEYVFKDIHQAWEFMCLVMVRLRRMTNHPDWRHVNNKVFVTLPSPLASCLTHEDSNLATFMDQIHEAIML